MKVVTAKEYLRTKCQGGKGIFAKKFGKLQQNVAYMFYSDYRVIILEDRDLLVKFNSEHIKDAE